MSFASQSGDSIFFVSLRLTSNFFSGDQKSQSAWLSYFPPFSLANIKYLAIDLRLLEIFLAGIKKARALFLASLFRLADFLEMPLNAFKCLGIICSRIATDLQFLRGDLKHQSGVKLTPGIGEKHKIQCKSCDFNCKRMERGILPFHITILQFCNMTFLQDISIYYFPCCINQIFHCFILC